MNEMNFYTQRLQLITVAQQSYQDELVAGTSGNLSVFDPENGIMIITPSSLPYNTMRADDAVCMKLNGEIVWGHCRPSSEWQMHAYIYQNMPDVQSVVHTHSPYATSLAVSHETLPVILIEMVPFLGGPVPVSDFALPGTVEMGVEAYKILKEGSRSCLLANHGVLTIGKNIHEAYIRAIYTEDAAKIYSLSKQNGKVYEIEQEHILAMKEKIRRRKE